jgi:hypothetical protein
MMKASAIVGITNVHARTLSHRVEAFQYGYARGIIISRGRITVGVFSHSVLTFSDVRLLFRRSAIKPAKSEGSQPAPNRPVPHFIRGHRLFLLPSNPLNNSALREKYSSTQLSLDSEAAMFHVEQINGVRTPSSLQRGAIHCRHNDLSPASQLRTNTGAMCLIKLCWQIID